MKKFDELLQECREKGISVPEGQKLSRNYLTKRLAEHHLAQTSGDLHPLEQISPQLAKDIRDLSAEEREEALKSDRYACGEKVNGVRGIMHIRPEGIRITSRNRCSDTHLLNELTDNLPHLCSLDLGQWEGSIFDGELYLKEDFIDLGSRTNALEATSALLHCGPDKAKEFQDLNGRIRYHIFDVIRARGEDLITLPLRERLEHLHGFKGVVESRGYGQFVDFETLVFAGKEEYFRKVIESGGEGIVLKDLKAPYYPGASSRSWLKVKRNSTLDAIIIGHERGKEWDKKGLIGSIELGVFDEKGELQSIGRVSSFPLQKRMGMTEIVNGSPSLKREFIGTVVECTLQDFNKNLKGRHLQVVSFRDGGNSKPVNDCRFDFSKEKERLMRAGMAIPDSLPTPNFLTAYLPNA